MSWCTWFLSCIHRFLSQHPCRDQQSCPIGPVPLVTDQSPPRGQAWEPVPLGLGWTLLFQVCDREDLCPVPRPVAVMKQVPCLGVSASPSTDLGWGLWAQSWQRGRGPLVFSAGLWAVAFVSRSPVFC